ncbi:hypothetical protein [Terrihalobacillus insolitus]|uniref:hypothetical protein n=1 Tax=Terrihalobacillus insolitus TaxID=2950438 RepID=UPI00234115AB|nr:hypothetical protein [Terrihalobacillus insolitus]MDC3413978.1 hypothetical protein [Terrihalobacillus insolitus]
MELYIALIAAGSAIFGSLIPQLFNFLFKRQETQRELQKEYKNNKVQAYVKLSQIISDMWHSDPVTEDRNKWVNDVNTQLEDFLIFNGVWLDDEEITGIKELQTRVVDTLKYEYFTEEQMKEQAIEVGGETLTKKVDDLLQLCRDKIKKDYHMS